jgi:hypothetical protein
MNVQCNLLESTGTQQRAIKKRNMKIIDTQKLKRPSRKGPIAVAMEYFEKGIDPSGSFECRFINQYIGECDTTLLLIL